MCKVSFQLHRLCSLFCSISIKYKFLVHSQPRNYTVLQCRRVIHSHTIPFICSFTIDFQFSLYLLHCCLSLLFRIILFLYCIILLLDVCERIVQYVRVDFSTIRMEFNVCSQRQTTIKMEKLENIFFIIPSTEHQFLIYSRYTTGNVCVCARCYHYLNTFDSIQNSFQMMHEILMLIEKHGCQLKEDS